MGNDVLIVDDDLAFAEMLSEILTSEQIPVRVMHDGVSGLAEAERVHPALMMLDYMMPGMNGMQVLEKVRSTTWGARIPVILLTNMSEPEAMANGSLKNTPTECLLKVDWTLDQIATHIKDTLAANAAS